MLNSFLDGTNGTDTTHESYLSYWSMLTDVTSVLFHQFSRLAATLAVNLLVQTSLVLAIGLFAAWVIRRRDAALQSCVLRMTLVATLFCPVASWLLYCCGVSGFRIELSLLEPQTDEVMVPSAPPLAPVAPVLPEIAITQSVNSDIREHSRSFEVPSAYRPSAENDASRTPSTGMESSTSIEPAGITAELPIESTSESSATRESSRRVAAYVVICGFWLLATGLMLFRLVMANLMMERLRRKSRLAPDDVVSGCRDIARQMSVNAPPVLVNDRLSSPCLLGWLRPAVMIPGGLHPISADVLAHELAHLRRNDCFWSLLGHLTTAMLPWQPLAWLLTRRMEQAADNVCDDYVVAHNFDRVSYARELVTIAERFPAGWSATTAAVGIAEFQSCLGSRVQRILDGSRTLSLRTGWKNLILVTAAALLGTIIAGVLGASRNGYSNANIAKVDEVGEAIAASSDANATSSPSASNEKMTAAEVAEPNADSQAKSTTSGEIVVKGVVLKPDGAAAAGATVRLGVPRFVERWPNSEQLATRETMTVVADENGRFEMHVRQAPFDQTLNGNERQPPSILMPIAASLGGFGATWVDLEGGETDKPITLRLVEDYVLRGQIVDLEGVPVRRTAVTLNRIDRLKDEDLTVFLSRINDGSFNIAFMQPWNVRKSFGLWEISPTLIGLPEKVTTDDEGWLEIRGMGKDRLVHFAFNGGDFAYRIVTVASRDMETIQPVGIQKRQAIQEPIYGAPCKIAVAPSRPIEGTVVDAATGEPLAGVTIGVSRRFEMEFALPVKTISGSDGRFRLMGLAKQRESELKVIPSEEQPYFGRTIEVTDTPGLETVELKISLHRGLWIKGRVTNKLTHEPIAGVHLHYYPLLSNDFAERLPKSAEDGDLDKDGDRYQSNPDGSYRLLGLPGPAVVGAEHRLMRFRFGVGLDEIKAPRNQRTNKILAWGQMNGPGIERSFAIREISPRADELETRLDLELDPGLSVKIRLIDEAKVPVKGASVWPGTRWQEHENAGDDGIRIVDNLGPNEKKVVYAHHEGRDLGAMINLEPPYEAGREITVVLRPLAKIAGRLLDVGEPMIAVTVDCAVETKDGYRQILGAWSTDRDGRFRVPVMPGHEYKLHMHNGSPEFYAAFKQPLTFSPGEIKDLGDLELNGHEFHSVNPIPPDAKAETTEAAMNASPSAASNLIAQSSPEAATSRSNPADDGERSNQRSTDTKLAAEITLTGLVLKPDGTPAAGAIIRSAAQVWVMIKNVLPTGFVPKMNETNADSEGKFSIAISQQPFGELKNLDERWLEIWKETQIAASLPGYGPMWVEFKNLEPGQPIVLRLVEDQPIRGQLIDLEGNPVVGTIVKLGDARAAKNDDLAAWLAGVKAGEPPWTVFKHAPRDVMPRLVGIPETVTTDQSGRLEIQGLGRDRIIALTLEGENVAHRTVTVVSRTMESMKRVISLPPFEGREHVFGAQFQFAVPPSRPIEGRVVDAATGLPLPGVSIESYKFADYPFSNHRVLKTVSDEVGRFRLVGMPKASGNQLLLVPNDDQPYFMRRVDVPDPKGIESVEMKIELHRGIWVKGKVTDKATHEPVAGVRIHYLPFRSNEFARQLPEFDSSGNTDGDQMRYVTESDGNYRVVGLPGRAVVGAESVMKAYRKGVGYSEIDGPKENDHHLFTWRNPLNPSASWPSVMREINPTSVENEVRLDLELDPGYSARLKLVDEQHDPVMGAEITGLLSIETSMSQGSTPQVTCLAPDESRMLRAYHKDRNIGLVIRLEPPHQDDREIVMEMLPCAKISGRLLNGGDPMAGVVVETRYRKESWGFLEHLPLFTTDSSGRFQGTLVSGAEYRLFARGASIKDYSAVIVDVLSVKPGEAKDLGDLTLGKDRNFEPANAAPKAEAGRIEPAKDHRLQFAGAVVHPDGKPMANARIYLVSRWQNANPVSDAKPITKTDSNGQFQVAVLDAEYDGSLNLPDIVVAAEGYGFASIPAICLETTGRLKTSLSPGALANVEKIQESQGTILRLVPDDVPLTIRVVNTEGQPVAGVQARVTEVLWNEKGNLDAWEIGAVESQVNFYTLRNSETPLELHGHLLPSIIHDGKTGEDGWFTIRGIGRERIVKITISGPGIQLAEHYARTRKGETVVLPPRSDPPSNIIRQQVYAPGAVHIAPVSVPIVGQVTESETGKPIEGVRIATVSTAYFGMQTGSGSRDLFAITDSQGRYRLDGVPVNEPQDLWAFPLNESLSLPVHKSVSTKPGQSHFVQDFKLQTGVPLHGRAVDSRTGEPIPGHVAYYAFPTNRSLSKFPDFATLRAAHERKTDAEGRFTIPVLPGAGMVTFGATAVGKYARGQGADSIPEYRDKPLMNRIYGLVPTAVIATNADALQPVAVSDDAKSANITFELSPGIEVVGKLVDSEGNPVMGAFASGRSGENGDGWFPLKDATYRVRANNPKSPWHLAFYHPTRELAADVQLNDAPHESLMVTLQPSGGIRGRLLDEHGVPMREFLLCGLGIPHPQYLRAPGKLVTDDDGRFEIRGLIPGRTYDVIGRKAGETIQTVIKAVTVESASVKELGDVISGKDRKSEPVKLDTKTETGQVEPVKGLPLLFVGSEVDVGGKPKANEKIFAGG